MDMLDALPRDGNSKILEIGAGSGNATHDNHWD